MNISTNDTNIKSDTDEKNTMIASCRLCGFSAHPDEFDPALSVYHDLRCPKCKTTDIDWTYGGYKDNFLIIG